ANRRRLGARELSCESLPEPQADDDLGRLEVPRVVQEELGRLPERLRAPIVLCYLEGSTHELAARHLGCPVGTVRSRLARARALLQRRIARRGLAVSSATLAGILESNARAATASPSLRIPLVKVMMRFVCQEGSNSLTGGVGISASVVALT